MGAMKEIWYSWLENNREELMQKFMDSHESINQAFEEWTINQMDSDCYCYGGN